MLRNKGALKVDKFKKFENVSINMFDLVPKWGFI